MKFDECINFFFHGSQNELFGINGYEIINQKK